MSKTMLNELVELNHLNGYKSARNECGITAFEERFNNATHNNIMLITEYAKSDVLKKVVNLEKSIKSIIRYREKKHLPLLIKEQIHPLKQNITINQ